MMFKYRLYLEDFDCTVFVEYDVIPGEADTYDTPGFDSQIDVIDVYHRNGDKVSDSIWAYLMDDLDTFGSIYETLLENAEPMEPW